MQNSKLSDNVIHLSDLTEAAMDEDDSFLPEQFAMNAESRKTVIEAIDRLPQRQKEAVLLHYYDRLNVTETADVMGISQPAASIHLKEACSRIKRDIESSADKLMRAMQGFVAIPLGDMLSRVLYMEGAACTSMNQAWMTETIAKCGDITLAGAVAVGGVAAGAAGAYKTVTGSSAVSNATSNMSSVAKTILTAITATAATLAITIGAILWQSPQNIEPVSANATAGVIFTSDNDVSYVNPTSATASSGSRHGELRVHHWDIQTMDGKTILYTGESSNVDESVFAQMHENEQYGDYEIVFTMEDANGKRYELAHNFFIYEEVLDIAQEENTNSKQIKKV